MKKFFILLGITLLFNACFDEKSIFDSFCEEEIKLDKSAKPNPKYNYLFKKYAKNGESTSKENAIFFIDELEKLANELFVYDNLKNINYNEVFASFRDSLDEKVYLKDLDIASQKVLALFSNGTYYLKSNLKKKYLPFIINNIEGNNYAFYKNSLLDENFPIIKSIDNIKIQEWIRISKVFVPKGNEVLSRENSYKTLGLINKLRLELGLKESNKVNIKLADMKNKNFKNITMNLVDEKDTFKLNFKPKKLKIPENIEYIKIDKLYKETKHKRSFKNILKQFYINKDKKAFIIDLRSTQDGSRELIKDSLPLMINKTTIINIEKLRLNDKLKTCNIEYYKNRFLKKRYNKYYEELDEEEKSIVDKKSDKKYLGLGKSRYFIAKPYQDNYLSKKNIIVLINSKTSGEVENYITALANLKSTTLIGSKTNGEFTKKSLAKIATKDGKFKVFLSFGTVMNFKENYEKYKGTKPDIEIETKLKDYLAKTDTVLEMAIKKINN